MASRITRAITRDHVLDFTYGSAGRLTAQAVDGATLRFTHDHAGRRRSRTTPSGTVTTWTQGADEDTARMSVSGRTIDFTYDAAGREVTRRIGEFATLTSSYNLAGRLVGQAVSAGHEQQLGTAGRIPTGPTVSSPASTISIQPAGSPVRATTGRIYSP
ncbi:hypothetical protein [Streptomyces sp. NPDC058385]|uniref:hypothetical protein n=1 Tax=Streptomyces sp. NPDC058385 TaxID=3346473 RepID=UPI00364A4118